MRLLIIGIMIVVFLVAGFFLFNNYIYHEKQADQQEIVTPYRATLTGEYVCLPHVGNTQRVTLDCALGIKTDTGEYYALDLGPLSQTPPPLQTGDRLSANGQIIPLEMISSDHWYKYDIEGIFFVTDSLQKL